MALFSGAPAGFHAGTDTIDTTAKVPLGTEACDSSGNIYKYLTGVASTVAGSVVTFDEAGLTTLIAANAVGPVAVAMAATVASTYGWYAVSHLGVSAACDTVAADVACYIDGTSGRVDDAVVTGDLIVGAMTRTTDSGGFCTVQISRPFVTNILG